MRRYIISVLLLLLLSGSFSGCYTSRKSRSELGGLMLLENIQLGRNRAYYSRHNIKTKREAYKKYKKTARADSRRIR